MFLKSLTLKGFKSFADTTHLEFEPGVTVVVGPNGSGKSNVVDAVAWVLGAQGPRTVRSNKMEDVIFAGTPKRPALGRAEVSLTIDNSAGLLPIDFSEVTITRTLFRTGESEYAINRVPCRLLDIQELLSDTGVGRQQHVIVSQGNLDAILNSRPEERRLVIEEAAGVLKFRRRKEKAERRLESTEASLVRLQDLLREVRRQLRPLERQADAARRHGDLVAELSDVRRYLLGKELGSVEARLHSAARSRAEHHQSEEQLRQALAGLDTEVLAAEAQETALSSEARVDIAEAVSRAEGLKARAAGMAALLAERRRSVERQLESAVDQDVIASLEAEAAALSQRLVDAEQEAAGLLPAADELAAAEESLERETGSFEAAWGGEERVTIDPAAEVRGELSALRSAVEASDGELRRLASGVLATEQRVARLGSEGERLRQVVAGSQQESQGLAQAERAAVEEEQEAERRTSVAEAEQRRADAEHHRSEAREEALAQALDEARARAGAERLATVEGVVGTLLELVEIEQGYEAAFEAAAGEVLSAVVVESGEAARRGLAELHRLAASGAVLALPEVTGAAGAGTVAPGGGLVAPGGGLVAPGGGPAARGLSKASPLRSRVRAWLPNVGVLLDRLLSTAVVAHGGWEDALGIAIENPDLVVVTRNGDRFSGGLWRAGAGGPGATAAALEDARRNKTEFASKAALAEGRLREAREELQQARARALQASRAAESNTARHRTAADALERIQAELADAASERAVALEQQQQLVERVERERQRVSELEALLPALEQAAEAEAERAAAERAARSRLAERTAAVAAMRRDLEVRAASLEERRTLTRRRLEDVEERLERDRVLRDEASVRRVRLEQIGTVTERLIELLRSRESELDGALLRLREARQAELQAARLRSEHLEHLRRQRAEAERQMSEIREKLNRIEIDETESRVRLEGITEAIRRDLDCEPDAVREAECPELPPGTSATSRRSELERELRLMGPINPLALEEYDALQERHQFLEAQLEDVRNARRELTKVIRAIDAEIVEVFRAAFADVAENFEALFSTLFPGGQGRLRLTDPDHLLETGIEVEARPSGKNVRRLSLLSGGERSLTALAFLFAVFRSRPSPFYLMDEVEAALDDVNLHRFLDLIHEFRTEAQLLVVSHQKRTMEAADCLYGVTMAPGGSSRVVSEKVSATVTAGS